jgi:hypothetical protein
MVPKIAHGTEKVNRIKDIKALLASKELKRKNSTKSPHCK